MKCLVDNFHVCVCVCACLCMSTCSSWGICTGNGVNCVVGVMGRSYLEIVDFITWCLVERGLDGIGREGGIEGGRGRGGVEGEEG